MVSPKTGGSLFDENPATEIIVRYLAPEPTGTAAQAGTSGTAKIKAGRKSGSDRWLQEFHLAAVGGSDVITSSKFIRLEDVPLGYEASRMFRKFNTITPTTKLEAMIYWGTLMSSKSPGPDETSGSYLLRIHGPGTRDQHIIRIPTYAMMVEICALNELSWIHDGIHGSAMIIGHAHRGPSGKAVFPLDDLSKIDNLTPLATTELLT